MSSSTYSYGSSYAQGKSAYAPRSSSPRSTTSTSTSASSSSLYAHRGNSQRNNGYGSKPGGTPVIHNGGGQSSGPSSTSAGNSGYYQ